MGLISRKIFPACGSMCVCCPALRPRSRHPVKRYKKILAEIFPKTPEGAPNDRKIVKLCEYATKNPFRIPKIVQYLEERCHKELRCGQIKYVNIVAEVYSKLLSMCNGQMVYFASSLLNMVSELLDNTKQVDTQILGCQTLTKFIYSQADSTYTHSIEKFVPKICVLAKTNEEENQRRCLRAASLQCLSSMVWFMTQYSYIFPSIDEIVRVTLDNYEQGLRNENENERGEPHRNWVNEVVRHDGRVGVGANDTSPNCIAIRPRPEKKNPSSLTREETETPSVWAQICIQRMVELAKEGSSIRQMLDPMFVYFDSRQQWMPRQGLALMLLSDISYLMESSGNQQLILASVIRHLDHKNAVHDPQLKSRIIQVAASLAKQIRSGTVLSDIGFVSDLCRHLRKSFQATVESAGEQEANSNALLQSSIEDCLIEIAKGIGDARPLFDMMATSLERLPSSGIVAQATIGSLLVLAHTISIVPVSSAHSQQAFPESLLVQLLKVMVHPNVEARVGAHQIFSVLLIPNSSHMRHEVASLRSGYLNEPKRWHSNASSPFASITALLEKLRNEKDGTKTEKNGCDVLNEGEDWKHGRSSKNSPNFYKLSSIIEGTSGQSNLAEAVACVMKFSEDQVAQLLSAFWIQATLPDNLPSNIEAIAHSFMLTIVYSRLKNPSENLVIGIFQLPLSLKNMSIDLNNGMLPPSCQRSVFMLSMGMLIFAAKIYQIPDLVDILRSFALNDIDPYLGINEDLQLYVKPEADVREHGSFADNQLAKSTLSQVRNKISESADNAILDILVRNLSAVTELEVDELEKQLREPFTPDDAFGYGPQSILGLNHNEMISHSKESLSFDEDIPTNTLLDDEVTSEASVSDMSRFISKMPASPTISHVISIGQLLESALEVAGQVAGTSISTSPIPYSTLTNRCEAFDNGTRQKLSNWLAHENHYNRISDSSLPAFPADRRLALRQMMSDGECAGLATDTTCLSMRLPPASPFDHFLKAARC
ncbi:hypothetical protein ACFE04_028705 [Oxalis oulophora]